VQNIHCGLNHFVNNLFYVAYVTLALVNGINLTTESVTEGDKVV